MRAILFSIPFLINFSLVGQVDTLFEENLRRVGDILFMELNEEFYGPSLLNRSFSSDSIILQQIKGDYNHVHSVYDFLGIYQDIALSYTDSTFMMNNEQFANHVEQLFIENEISTEEDELIQPFGLVYHYLSFIDSSKFNKDNFSVQGFSYIPTVDEQSLYTKALIKSGALLEFYPESGYAIGHLKFTPSLLSISPDIEGLSLRMDVGNGFVDFNASNPLIAYDRTTDSLIGRVEVSIQRQRMQIIDTIQFYLTTIGESDEEIQSKSNKRWDYTFGFGGDPAIYNGILYTCGVRTGCGNQDYKFRRPIIISAPYRPAIQPFSMKKYFNQFNFKSLITSLSDMGYDVIFLKQHPGNASLEQAGESLINFIDWINAQKLQDYPNEHWENILIGYSMGGQIARYALKLKEHSHMNGDRTHHHTRLYIPYDSPHLGANIPMFTQIVYKDLRNSSIFAHLAYNSLVDEASKDMSVSHVIAAPPTTSYVGAMKVLKYEPAETAERIAFINALTNNFNHEFTPTNDLRLSYPSFTRNVAVSTGRNDEDYTDEFGLNPGMLLFNQNAVAYTLTGLKYKNRRLYSSKYASDHTLFRNEVELILPFVLITIRNRDYRMNYAYEWDMSQGGYKDEFYDKFPTGAVPILRLDANGWGQKHYSRHMNFLPLVSALGINPTIWQNNNLFFDMREEGLMFESYENLNGNIRSELFGYPHLAHPSNHFNITPFEAVYADPQTYEHIKMKKSIGVPEDNLNPEYLVHTRNFILDEVEADVVALQNKVIGKNHNQGLANYKYRAWYKAHSRIEIGNTVTPKTNPGDYIIESTGDITVYAGQSVSLKPGFHAQAGSDFHAFIAYDGCSRPREDGKSSDSNSQTTELDNNTNQNLTDFGDSNNETIPDIVVYPNPTRGSFVIKVPHEQLGGSYSIINTNGNVLQTGVIKNSTHKKIELPNGVYFLHWKHNETLSIKKIIVL
jgi:hypothetical protein